MRWKYAVELSEATQPDEPVGSVYVCTTAPDVGDSSSRKSSTVPVAPSAAVPVPKRSAITFPGVGGTFVCGAEHTRGEVLIVGDGVGVCDNDAVDAADAVDDVDTDAVNDVDGVLVTVGAGVAPADWETEAVSVADAVVDMEAVADREFVAVTVAVAEDDGTIGAIASERYSVLLHACAMAERAPLTVL